MSRSSKKLVVCPVCSGGIRTWARDGIALKCSLCRGKREVTTEVDAAYWLLHNRNKSPRYTGKQLRKNAPELFPDLWWKRLIFAVTNWWSSFVTGKGKNC